MLDAEFAMILYDSRKRLLIAARDPIGIRPLFYGYSESGSHRLCLRGRKTSLGCAKRCYPFPHRQLLLQTASSCATATSPTPAAVQPG